VDVCHVVAKITSCCMVCWLVALSHLSRRWCWQLALDLHLLALVISNTNKATVGLLYLAGSHRG